MNSGNANHEIFKSINRWPNQYATSVIACFCASLGMSWIMSPIEYNNWHKSLTK